MGDDLDLAPIRIDNQVTGDGTPEAGGVSTATLVGGVIVLGVLAAIVLRGPSSSGAMEEDTSNGPEAADNTGAAESGTSVARGSGSPYGGLVEG